METPMELVEEQMRLAEPGVTLMEDVQILDLQRDSQTTHGLIKPATSILVENQLFITNEFYLNQIN